MKFLHLRSNNLRLNLKMYNLSNSMILNPKFITFNDKISSYTKDIGVVSKYYNVNNGILHQNMNFGYKINLNSLSQAKFSTSVGEQTTKVLSETKKSIFLKIRDAVIHAYHGMRLFFLEIKVSTRLLSRTLIYGNELSRRERRQLIRTLADVLKIFPYFIFLVVPLLEFFLPLYLKFFPFMLPSTFKTNLDKKNVLKKSFQNKLEIAKVFQDTLESINKENKVNKINKFDENSLNKTQDLSKVEISNMDLSQIINYLKDFEDELTLDKLDKIHILQLCKLLSLPSVGPLGFLRFQLRLKSQLIKNDDKVILKEGMDKLTKSELREALKARGLPAYKIPEDTMRSQLDDWVKLSILEKIPASILLLSSAVCTNTGHKSLSGNLSTVIKEIPEQLKNELRYAKDELDSNNARKVIEAEEASIREENEYTESKSDSKKIHSDDDSSKGKFVSTDVADRRENELDFDDIADALEDINSRSKKISTEDSDIDELKTDISGFKKNICSNINSKGDSYLTANSSKKKQKSSELLEKKIDTLVNNLQDISKDICKTNAEESNVTGNKVNNEDTNQMDIECQKVNSNTHLKITRKELIDLLKGKESFALSDLKRVNKLIDCIGSDKDSEIEVNKAIELLKTFEMDSDSHGLTIDQLSIISKILKQKKK